MASRFEILRKEINRGLKVEEKSGVMINDWTPNNVRRLIIGTDCAIVCYHVTGGKFTTLMKVVEFGTDSSAECFEYHQGEANIKPLLSVLVDGRICSCIEEIVFCTAGYDADMLRFDSDLSILLGNKKDVTASTLHNRFPRLHSIYKVNDIVPNIWEQVQNSKSASTLLYTTLVGAGVRVMDYNQVALDWYKGSYLRPNLYTMDGPEGALARRFESVKAYYLNLEHNVKMAKAEAQKYAKTRENFLPLYSTYSRAFYSLYEGCNSVYNNCSLLEKATWGSFIVSKKAAKLFRKENEGNIEKDWKYIDFNKLHTILLATNNSEESMSVDVSFLTLVYNLVEYGKFEMVKDIPGDVKKREYRSVENSITLFKAIVNRLLNIYIRLIFAALIKNVGVNGAKYAAVNYQRLTTVDASKVVYHRGMIDNISSLLPENIGAGEILSEIGATHTTSETMSVFDRITSALTILEILEKKE